HLFEHDYRCPRRARGSGTWSRRDHRSEVLLRVLLCRDRRDARRVGTNHSAQLGKGPPVSAPSHCKHRNGILERQCHPSALSDGASLAPTWTKPSRLSLTNVPPGWHRSPRAMPHLPTTCARCSLSIGVFTSPDF